MKGAITVDGKKLRAQTCTANEWFDALELEKKRDQDFLLIATCIVDANGKRVYTPEQVGKLPVTTFASLYALTLKANRPESPEKK